MNTTTITNLTILGEAQSTRLLPRSRRRRRRRPDPAGRDPETRPSCWAMRCTRLRELPASSIDCCVTSPPYYALRDYFVPGQIGLEPSVDDWVSDLVAVMAEVGRVLKPGGSLWLNLGDSFSRHPKFGAPAKSLLAAPERLLLALMREGWIVRSKVIWSKPNALPNSVADRLNLTYEVVYFLVRSPRYFFDLDAIREPHRSRAGRRDTSGSGRTPEWAGPLAEGSQRRTAPLPAGGAARSPAWEEPWLGVGDPNLRIPGTALRHLPAGSRPAPDLGDLPGGCLHSLRPTLATAASA